MNVSGLPEEAVRIAWADGSSEEALRDAHRAGERVADDIAVKFSREEWSELLHALGRAFSMSTRPSQTFAIERRLRAEREAVASVERARYLADRFLKRARKEAGVDAAGWTG